MVMMVNRFRSTERMERIHPFRVGHFPENISTKTGIRRGRYPPRQVRLHLKASRAGRAGNSLRYEAEPRNEDLYMILL